MSRVKEALALDCFGAMGPANAVRQATALPHRSGGGGRSPAVALALEAAQVAARTGKLEGWNIGASVEDQQWFLERSYPVDGACSEIDNECTRIGLDHNRGAACLARTQDDVSS
jgi:hypothetical protein